MDYLKELYSRRGGGMKFGLERTIKFINYLQNPQNNFKSIHVAGTNGKGSVVNILAKILQEYGLKVGKFTSPHLVNFNERIQINSEKIKIVLDYHQLSIILDRVSEFGYQVFKMLCINEKLDWKILK